MISLVISQNIYGYSNKEAKLGLYGRL